MISFFVQIALFVFPWPLRRKALNLLFKYDIHETARIGWSIVISREVILGAGSRIGSLTLVKNLSELRLGPNAILGNMNWVSATVEGHPVSFAADLHRRPALILHRESAVTHRHLIDCNDTVEIGEYSTIAGWGSQILTHSIDLVENRQKAAPVSVGSYCFVGTRSVLLQGSVLPARSVLAAGAVLVTKEAAEGALYTGVPAKFVKILSKDLAYFSRSEGVVQ